MSWEAPGFKPPALTASADLSAKQYTAVKASGVNTVTSVAAATDAVLGVLQNKPTSGQEAEITHTGVTKMLAGAAVTAGAEVMCDTSGRAITAVTTGNRILGIALETAANANEVIAVLLYSGAPKV